MALTLAEGALALVLWWAPAWKPLSGAVTDYYLKYERRIIQFDPLCARYDPELAYTLKQGSCQFDNRDFQTTVTINSLGVRGDESALDDPEIVVLGDSFSMGWGVEDKEGYPALLAASSGRRTSNLSIPSYGTARARDFCFREQKPDRSPVSQM
jgi:hypothetical protein